VITISFSRLAFPEIESSKPPIAQHAQPEQECIYSREGPRNRRVILSS
jgi:hypothetical protein